MNFNKDKLDIGVATARELVERYRSHQTEMAADSRRTLDTVVGYMAYDKHGRMRLTYPEPIRQILRDAGLSEWS